MPTPRLATKPILVGESNPYGADPHYALFPLPEGCSGHRLCHKVLGMSRRTYLESFDRVNLCVGEWCGEEARTKAVQLLSDPRREKFLLLGSKVSVAFGLRYLPLLSFGARLILPHPSGACRLWDEPGTFEHARRAVALFLPSLAHLLGTDE